MKGFRKIPKASPFDTGEIVNPFGMDGVIKVRRLFHHKSGFGAYNEMVKGVDAILSDARAAAVVRLVKAGVPDAARLSDRDLKRLDSEFAKAHASHDSAALIDTLNETLALRLIVTWSGEAFDVVPDKGAFDEEMKVRAFFPSERREIDDEIVPNFFEVDADGNDKQPLYEGDDLFAKAVALREAAQKAVDLLDPNVPIGDNSAKKTAEIHLDDELGKINIRRHPCGGLPFRKGLAQLIISKAEELESAHRKRLSL